MDTLAIAKAERERRKRDRFASFPSYGEWLESRCPTYSWDWEWLRLCQQTYDQVTAGVLKKVMIFAPPQHGKSEGGTVRYPVHRLERDPATRIIIAGHSARLACKFSRKALKIADTCVPVNPKKRSAEEWETTAGGGLRAVGVGGSIAGTPGELIFIDDPVRNRQEAASVVIQEKVYEWFTDDVVTRCQEGGAIVLQMTRWHEGDLAGRILESEDGPNWTVLRLPALAETQEERDEWAGRFGRPAGQPDPLGREPGEPLCPERFSRATLENRRKILRVGFYALYQQTPRAKEGGYFQKEWFPIVDRCPEKPNARLRWWDCAATEGDGDWTAGVRMSKAKVDGTWKVYIEDVRRGQLGSSRRDKLIRATTEADPAGTKQWREQEPGSSGKDAAEAFVRLLMGYPASYEPSTGSKEVRADALASAAANGDVYLVRGDWNAALLAELVEFPNGRHDDQVDGASGGFNKLMKGRKVEAS